MPAASASALRRVAIGPRHRARPRHTRVRRQAPRHRARRREPRHPARRDGLDRRAVGLRQVHAAQPHRRPRPADLRRGPRRRPGARRPVRRRADARAARQDRLHLPVLQPAADAVLPRERRPAAAPARLAAAEGRRARARAARRSCSSGTGCSICPTSSRAASASASPSRARCRSIRRSCWPTSRPATSTRTPAQEILALIRDLHARLGSTVLIVTHDMKVAESCARTIALRDGRIVEDVRR